MLFRPKVNTGHFQFALELLFSKTNPRARSGLFKAFATNNPSYGLLNAWSELEFQVNKHKDISFEKSKSKQIIAACTKSLSLSESDQERLTLISQQRNGVAHAIGGRSPPTWSNVLFVLSISKKYRNVKK